MPESLWWMVPRDGRREVVIKDKETTDHAVWEPREPFDPSQPPPTWVLEIMGQ
jgi:hypothetical protein